MHWCQNLEAGLKQQYWSWTYDWKNWTPSCFMDVQQILNKAKSRSSTLFTNQRNLTRFFILRSSNHPIWCYWMNHQKKGTEPQKINKFVWSQVWGSWWGHPTVKNGSHFQRIKLNAKDSRLFLRDFPKIIVHEVWVGNIMTPCRWWVFQSFFFAFVRSEIWRVWLTTCTRWLFKDSIFDFTRIFFGRNHPTWLLQYFLKWVETTN